MTIVKHERTRGRIEIDLSGPEGNAFALMGYASNFAKQLGRDPKPIIERMKAGDYENLLQVFDGEFGEFGEFVTLIRAADEEDDE